MYIIKLLFALLLLNITCSRDSQNTNQPKNILLLCIDDLRPELNCYGVDYIHSPNIDELAKNGMLFEKHYVNAPSCGPSRFTFLTGKYGPAGNDALFERASEYRTSPEHISPSMPEWFGNNGYKTISVGKVSHHPGGWGGDDWNDTVINEMPLAWDEQLMPVGLWKTPRGAMHGLANGEIRKVPAEMDVYQSKMGTDRIYPDGLIVEEGLTQLRKLTFDGEKPFFLAIGLIKPHLPFGAPKKYLDQYKDVILPPIVNPMKPKGRSTWHNSNEFMHYNRWGKDPRIDMDFADSVRLHYAACVSYMDNQVGKILDVLKKSGADKNTIVVLWGDHGWHLGEHAIWGKHSLFEESLRSPMIISYPGMKNRGKECKSMISTIDIFPTLCELSGIDPPDFVQGESILPYIEKPATEGHPVIAYFRNERTIRTTNYRLTVHKDGFVELYDHNSPELETRNIAKEKPQIVDKLLRMLDDRMEEENISSFKIW